MRHALSPSANFGFITDPTIQRAGRSVHGEQSKVLVYTGRGGGLVVHHLFGFVLLHINMYIYIYIYWVLLYINVYMYWKRGGLKKATHLVRPSSPVPPACLSQVRWTGAARASKLRPRGRSTARRPAKTSSRWRFFFFFFFGRNTASGFSCWCQTGVSSSSFFLGGGGRPPRWISGDFLLVSDL